MFNIFIIALLSILGILGINIPIHEVYIVGWILISLSVVWTLVTIITTFATYSSQLDRFEKLRSIIQDRNSYDEMQKSLLIEFKLYLGQKFPELEERILKTFNMGGDVNLIMNYPEIKSTKALITLVEKINRCKNELYSYERKIHEKSATIRYYSNGKWEYIKPTIPSDLIPYVNKTI